MTVGQFVLLVLLLAIDELLILFQVENVLIVNRVAADGRATRGLEPQYVRLVDQPRELSSPDQVLADRADLLRLIEHNRERLELFIEQIQDPLS